MSSSKYPKNPKLGIKVSIPRIPEAVESPAVVDEEDVSSSTHFIPRRPQSKSGSKAPRPHSIGATIISNPKLVKGWQYYDNDPNPKNIQKYFSTINLPPAQNDEFVQRGSDSEIEDSAKVRSLNRETGEILACVEKRKRPCERYIGIFLALLASAALALSSIIVKAMENYHPYSVSVWTFQGIFIPSLLVLLSSWWIRKENVFKLSRSDCPGPRWKSNCKTATFISIRAVFGWLGVVFKCYSLQYMSVADSTIIAFSSPVFVVIFAWIFLKEKLGVIPIITAVVVLIGVGVITRPPLLSGEQTFDKNQLIGTSMAVSCMLLGVFTVLILRSIRHVHYAFVTFIYGLVGTVGCLFLCWYIGEFQFPRNGRDWIFAGGIAALTFIGQSLITLALKYEQASTFALIRTSEIPFTFAWQIIFLHTSPDLLTFIGASLVIIGVFIITGRKWIEMQPATHGARKWLGFLLI